MSDAGQGRTRRTNIADRRTYRAPQRVASGGDPTIATARRMTPQLRKSGHSPSREQSAEFVKASRTPAARCGAKSDLIDDEVGSDSHARQITHVRENDEPEHEEDRACDRHLEASAGGI